MSYKFITQTEEEGHIVADLLAALEMTTSRLDKLGEGFAAQDFVEQTIARAKVAVEQTTADRKSEELNETLKDIVRGLNRGDV